MRSVAELPVVFTADDLRLRGVTQEQAEYRVRRGVWRRLHKGVYCAAETWARANAEARHVLTGMALVRAGEGEDLVLSHVTAATVHDLPVAPQALRTVTMTTVPGGRRARGDDRHVYYAPLPDIDRMLRDGVPVTTVARTVADCLRHLPLGDAVAVADAALHGRATSLDEIREVLRRQERWPFAGVAALTLPLLDGRRESRLESRSAVVMHQHRIPRPVSQCRILDPTGRQVARVDFAWLELGVVGEADGRVKYGQDAGRVIEEEKDRHSVLEALGLVIVRWGERHLHGPRPEMVYRLNDGFRRADGRRFRGKAA